jgi:hypothetical protein
MPTVIRGENLSKKFVIGHQHQESYTALRVVELLPAAALNCFWL